MADWNIAYNWMMDNEDALRTCEQVPDAPPGAFAIGGINSVTWPEAFAAVVALAQEKREPFVRQFHENHFWNMWHEQLESDEVSKRVFDFAVNGGSGSSVRCLQQALNHLSSPDLHRGNFDDAVPVDRRKACGFNVENNKFGKLYIHYYSLKDAV